MFFFHLLDHILQRGILKSGDRKKNKKKTTKKQKKKTPKNKKKKKMEVAGKLCRVLILSSDAIPVMECSVNFISKRWNSMYLLTVYFILFEPLNMFPSYGQNMVVFFYLKTFILPILAVTRVIFIYLFIFFDFWKSKCDRKRNSTLWKIDHGSLAHLGIRRISWNSADFMATKMLYFSSEPIQIYT